MVPHPLKRYGWT